METNPEQFEPVIGLEVHLQFDTETKIFCGCANKFGQEPNTLTCPVCLGLPGSLPVLNRKVLDYGIKVGVALNCEINKVIKFDRKNYYYPDLPKAYQISQYDMPVARRGYLIIKDEGGNSQRIRINRAHLEEDAGKLIHDNEENCSLVDYNRTGTPLLEIVTEPDIFSAGQAYSYLHALKLTLLYLDVSDCNMEKGSLRCDANISLRKSGTEKLGTKTEIKNMNSFKAVKAGLEYEITRQTKLLSAGESIVQETRLWDEDKGVTISMRSKEEAHDYRYFPEPDLVPFAVEQSKIDEIKNTLRENPFEKKARFMGQYNLSDYDAGIIIQDINIADFFELCAESCKDYKKISNWIIGPLMQEMNSRKAGIQDIKITPEELSRLISLVDDSTLSNLAAKEVLGYVLDSGKTVDRIVEEKGLAQVSDESMLNSLIAEIIADNENVADQIREGKESAVGFLVGQAMKKTQGKANPKKIKEIIKKLLIKDKIK